MSCNVLFSYFFHIFCVFLGGPEEYRWRGGSRDAQDHFRRPAEWGRDGQSYGGGWRGRYLPGEKHSATSNNSYTDKIQSIDAYVLIIIHQFWWNLLLDWMISECLVRLTVYTNPGFCLHMCVSLCISSVHMVCLVTAWSHSPASPPTLSPNRWPTSGLSNSLRHSLSLH